MRPRLRIRTVVALTWIVVAVGMTLLLAPQLGLRGWMWLGVHHWLCLYGAGWELLEDRRLARGAKTYEPTPGDVP